MTHNAQDEKQQPRSKLMDINVNINKNYPRGADEHIAVMREFAEMKRELAELKGLIMTKRDDEKALAALLKQVGANTDTLKQTQDENKP